MCQRDSQALAASRRGFLQGAAAAAAASFMAASPARAVRRPNILFAIADDWSWPHASIYGAKEVHTPNFDRIAREGCLFANGFTAAPQCSPNRAATLTGRNIWQIEEAGTHGSLFPSKFPVWTDALEDDGYHVGFVGKGWSPGNYRGGGWERNPAGTEYHARSGRPEISGYADIDYAGGFERFLSARPDSAPFCFWYGSKEPHRRYEEGSGIRLGKNPDNCEAPPFLPDTPKVRSDILDYYVEVEHFDAVLGQMLAQLEAIGELDNTLVVVTSDNGMPFPRAKANLYEFGTHVPLAMRWPGVIEPGRRSDALVSFIDFGPTFLEAAGLGPLEGMTGRSLMPHLKDASAPHRDYVLTGRERHTHARYDNWGYPARAIRSDAYLYIWNVKPDRWPAGDPPLFADIDASPSKDEIIERRHAFPALYEASVGKRPEHELYLVNEDPACMRNLADKPEHQEALEKLQAELQQRLKAQGDPRVLGSGDIFESYPRFSGMRPELGGFAEQGAYNPYYLPD